MLTSAPIVKIANSNEDFVVCIDACKKGIGRVLTQNGHVICDESRNIKEHGRNYSTNNLEFFPIVHALNISIHYWMGRKFEFITNHHGLKYLFEQQYFNARQVTWLEFVLEFYFNIKQVKEKKNKNSMHSVGK